MREETYGGVRVRVCGGLDGNGSGKGLLVVLLHGYGAPGDDLVPLASALRVPREVRFAFPEAPIDLGRDAMGGRAWWHIDMAALQARARGELTDRTHEVPQGLVEAHASVETTLDGLTRDLAPSAILLGGFSQGAMLACDMVMQTKRSFAALAMMSGTLIAQQHWEKVGKSRAGLHALVSHGRADPILPYAAAEKLRDFLTSVGLVVDWVPFQGGHGIPPDVMNGLARLIAGVSH